MTPPPAHASEDSQDESGIYSALCGFATQRAEAGAKVLWIGSRSLPRVTTSHLPLSREHDYRMAADAHQAFDFVFLLEPVLTNRKSWPLILDETLRLLAPQGVLFLRFTPSRLLSIHALKHSLFQWGDLDLGFEEMMADGSVVMMLASTRTARREVSAHDVSFGVLSHGERTEKLALVLDSIAQLHMPEGSVVETIVCGPEAIRPWLQRSYPGVTLIPEPEMFQDKGWITKKKNLIVDSAQHSNLVIAHDRYAFDARFLEALVEFGGDFDLLVARQSVSDGRRFPDWVTLGAAWSLTNPATLPYGEYSPYWYINGGLTIGKTARLQALRWNELIFWDQAEDVELSRRAQAAGMVPRMARALHAITHGYRPGMVEGFESMPAVESQIFLPGPSNASPEAVLPTVATDTTIGCGGDITDQQLALFGICLSGEWEETEQGRALRQNTVGELSGRLPLTPEGGARCSIALRTTGPGVTVIIEGADPSNQPAPLTESVHHFLIPPASLRYSNIFRLRFACDSVFMELHSITVTLLDASGVPKQAIASDDVRRLFLGVKLP